MKPTDPSTSVVEPLKDEPSETHTQNRWAVPSAESDREKKTVVGGTLWTLREGSGGNFGYAKAAQLVVIPSLERFYKGIADFSPVTQDSVRPVGSCTIPRWFPSWTVWKVYIKYKYIKTSVI